MRLQLTIKYLLLGGTLGIFLLFAYSEISAHQNGNKNVLVKSNKNERRMASIDGQELESILRSAASRKSDNVIKNDLAAQAKFNVSKIDQKRMQRARDKLNGKYRSGGYANRTLIEDLQLPEEWSLSPTLEKTLADRKDHVREVCHKYGLDQRTKKYQPNAWEYIYNKEYNLVWCPIFKAASSTWMFNFNLLSGYTEDFLYGTKDMPVILARKKYPRLKTETLDEIFSSSSKPLTFMITRHPFERLVSAFRDKIESGKPYYINLFKEIPLRYPNLSDDLNANEIDLIPDPLESARQRKRNVRVKIPSFRQFTQYLIDEIIAGRLVDEHWRPMNDFCTPCLTDINVFAKVETLDEDGNFIIFNSGIEHVIKPKRINRSKKGPTNNVVSKYLCQLSPMQQAGLVEAYKFDLELFQYEYKELFNCSSVLL